MFSSIVEFLVMLNPFALFLYLEPIRKELSPREYYLVIIKATIISLVICLLFFYSGDTIFKKILHIDFEAFRIFGGIIIFSYAFIYIVKGDKALFDIKGGLDTLASTIAVPFMVGAGVISLSILLSRKQSMVMGSLSLLIIFIVNLAVLYGMVKFRDSLEGKFQHAFDKNMEVLLRLNGFFIGAIGINMVLMGIRNLFLS
jgi:multiple antibiotic resistance protein